MKRKILIILLVLIMFSGGYAVAESVNGSWNGLPIVKLFSQGMALESSDSPAVILNDHVYVPLKALNPIGAQLTWNGNDYSVDVTIPKSKDLSDLYAQFGSTIISSASITMDGTGKEILTVTTPLDLSKTENDTIDNSILLSVKDYNVSVFDMKYAAGEFSLNISDIREYEAKKINVTELFKRAISNTSNMNTKPVLTTSDIVKLSNRVGIIYTYDQFNNPIAQGSGFIVNSYGFMVTNNHVMKNASNWSISVGGNTYKSKYFWFKNETTDLYGMYVNTKENSNGTANADTSKTFQYLTLNTQIPKVGDKVFAIGSPLGLENTVSEGIVSGIRTINGMTMIQHTANTDHGSSGGCLLNEYGEVIGVTSSGIDGTSLDFAIPASYVQDELDKLK